MIQLAAFNLDSATPHQNTFYNKDKKSKCEQLFSK